MRYRPTPLVHRGHRMGVVRGDRCAPRGGHLVGDGPAGGRTKEERGGSRGLTAVMTVGTLGSAFVLLVQIVSSRDALTPDTLLGRGATAWFTTVIIFSLWYWELDRGGPAERAVRSPVLPSFAFPEDSMPELSPPGWMPSYPDYLYLAFTNATAFSPTDTVPLRTWAKMTMMVQSAVALAIAVLVVARAINLLPS